ncbi:hypothetical protein HDV05_001814 [Chytridiales sp. JEL 0842]|nr:hypothetical protein HDV05_001814 [Chytridiales sp. JEL 0842]
MLAQSADFSWVQQTVSTYARACSYDHAGYGWSQLGPFPRTVEAITNDLVSLLETNGVTQDMIFVGHSLGGFTTRVAQRRIKNKVRGLVLVDPVSHLDLKTCQEGATDPPQLLSTLAIHFVTYGLVRTLSWTPYFPEISNIRSLPMDIQNSYLFNIMNVASRLVANSEQTHRPGSCGYTKRVLETFPNPNLRTVNVSLQDQIGLGDLPFGLILCKVDATNTKTLFNVSSNQYNVHATRSSHNSILYKKEEAVIVSDVMRAVWDRAVNGIEMPKEESRG